MASKQNLTRSELKVDTKYLTSENINNLFQFGKDEQINIEEIEINDMFKPSLMHYYNTDVQNW